MEARDPPSIWRYMGEDTREAAATTFHAMVRTRLEADGIEFGAFSVAWMEGIPDCHHRVMFRRSGRKVHVTCDMDMPWEMSTLGLAAEGVTGRMVDIAVEAIVEHLGTRQSLGRYVASVWHSMQYLLPHLPDQPLLADHVSKGPRNYVAYARLITNSLAEQVTPIPMGLGGSTYEQRLQPIITTQRVRLHRLEAAGSRQQALTCCPVAAAVIAIGDKRSGRSIAYMRKAVTRGATTFVDGHYSPSVALGGGVTWKDGRMQVPLQGLPHTLRDILDGRSIGDIVGHPWLPPGRIASHMERGDHLELQAEFDPVPLVPVLEAAGMTIDQLA